MDQNNSDKTENTMSLTIQLEKLLQIGISLDSGIVTIDGAMKMFPVDKPQVGLKIVADALGLPTKRKRRTKAEIAAEAAKSDDKDQDAPSDDKPADKPQDAPKDKKKSKNAA